MTVAKERAQFAKEALLPVPEALNAILILREEAQLLTAVGAGLSELVGLNAASQLRVKGALVALDLRSRRIERSTVVVRRLHSVDLSRQLVRVDGGSEVYPLAAVLPGPPTAQQWREACRELAGRLLRGKAEHVTAAELRSVCERLAVLQRCAAELPAPGQPVDAARRTALEGVLAACEMDAGTWALWCQELGKWLWDAERAAQLAATGGPVEPASEEVKTPQPSTPQQRRQPRTATLEASPADQPQGTSACEPADDGLAAETTTTTARSRQGAGGDGSALKRPRGCGLRNAAGASSCECPDAEQQQASCVPNQDRQLELDLDLNPDVTGQTDGSAKPPCRLRAEHPGAEGTGLPPVPPCTSALPPGTSTVADVARQEVVAATTASDPHSGVVERSPQHRPSRRSRSRSRSRSRLRYRAPQEKSDPSQSRSRSRPRSDHRSTSRPRSGPRNRCFSRSRSRSRDSRAGSRSPGRSHRGWRTAEDWAADVHRVLLRQPGRKMAWLDIARAGFEIPTRFKAPERSLTGFLYSFRDLWTLSDPNRPKHEPLELTAIPPEEARCGSGAEAEAKWRTAEDWARDVHRHILSQRGGRMSWAELARAGFEIPLKLKPRHIALARFLGAFGDLWALSGPNRPRGQPLELIATPRQERRGRSRERSRSERGLSGVRSASGSPPQRQQPPRGQARGTGSERAERCGADKSDGGEDWGAVVAWAEAVYRHLLKQPDLTVKVSHLRGAGLGLPDRFLGGLSAAAFLKGPGFGDLWTAWKPDMSAPLRLTALPGALEPWLERQRELEQERQWEREREAPVAREADRERTREIPKEDPSGRKREASGERGTEEASPCDERQTSQRRAEAGPSHTSDPEACFQRRVATFLSGQPGRCATLPVLCRAGLAVPTDLLAGRSPAAWYRAHKSLWWLSKDNTLTVTLEHGALERLGVAPE